MDPCPGRVAKPRKTQLFNRTPFNVRSDVGTFPSLGERGGVTAAFQLQRVFVYEAVSYVGEPRESEEMRPRWFRETDLPFKVTIFYVCSLNCFQLMDIERM